MTITHPAWCSPEDCTVSGETPHGTHVSASTTITAAGASTDIEVYLLQGTTPGEPVLLITEVWWAPDAASALGTDRTEPVHAYALRLGQATQLRLALGTLIDASRGGTR